MFFCFSNGAFHNQDVRPVRPFMYQKFGSFFLTVNVPWFVDNRGRPFGHQLNVLGFPVTFESELDLGTDRDFLRETECPLHTFVLLHQRCHVVYLLPPRSTFPRSGDSTPDPSPGRRSTPVIFSFPLSDTP